MIHHAGNDHWNLNWDIMKIKLFLISLLILSSCATTRVNKEVEGVYEIACGKCIYKMTGDECDIAVLINGKHYYVEGSDISDHGNEHAEDGLCNSSRKAQIKGKIKFGIFMAEYVKIIEE